MNKKQYVKVVSQERLTDDIYSLVIEDGAIAEQACPGQFINLYTSDPSRLLPRPISICDVEGDTVRMVYRTVGEGTKQFSTLRAGDEIAVMGPIGNGYEMCCAHPVLMGGGIGIPPMLYLCKRLAAAGVTDISVILGYRDETFLLSEFEKCAKVYISSDSGRVGVHGTVIDAAREFGLTGDMICACGPKPMLKAVKAYAEEVSVRAQISLEERMACGVGACLACVTETTDIDGHSNVRNKRICVDGPVFYAEEVVL